MTTQIRAQANAAQLCLTILRDAGLIGPNKLTKLGETRAAILEVLGKMYQVCNEGEEFTGECLERVRNTVTQLYGRAKWADHNAMMDMVEGAFERFIQEHMETVAEAEATVTETATSTADQAMAVKDVQAIATGLEQRIGYLTDRLNCMPSEELAETVITGKLGCVAFEFHEELGIWQAAPDLTLAKGFSDAAQAIEVCPFGKVCLTRKEAIADALRSSHHALMNMNAYLGGAR
ncbi:MAG: hypothetical protein ACRCTP_17740 [Aeromonas popoffii]|uniref:hypothetical protein n=1 Tax=Aeromonas popoffii TaxID=70856 RepID=UPI003F39974F